MEHEELTSKIIAGAIEVHKRLGPGLLESTYEQCFCHELKIRKMNFKNQISIPVKYRNITLDCGYRIDLLVEDKIIIEIKAVEKMKKIFEAQLLTYMKLSEKPVGLLINFNTEVLKQGVRRLSIK